MIHFICAFFIVKHCAQIHVFAAVKTFSALKFIELVTLNLPAGYAVSRNFQLLGYISSDFFVFLFILALLFFDLLSFEITSGNVVCHFHVNIIRHAVNPDQFVDDLPRFIDTPQNHRIVLQVHIPGQQFMGQEHCALFVLFVDFLSFLLPLVIAVQMSLQIVFNNIGHIVI